MRISSVHIQNFRNLENFKISFDSNLTVLVANNSAGKTAVLDAISVLFGSYIGKLPTEKNNGFVSRDAMIKDRGDVPRYPISVQGEITFEETDATVYRELTSRGSRTTTVNTKKLQEYAKSNYEKLIKKEDVRLPILAYYGTGRLYKETKKDTRTYEREKSARSYGYHNCLNPNSNYKEFREWFIEQSQNELSWLRKNLKKSKNVTTINTSSAKLLDNIRRSVDKVLSHLGWKSLSFNGEELVIENRQEVEISVDSLSDGVKNLLTLVADIAYRCVKLNPHLEDPLQETNGIVLIDEIEMHLHPSWQQRVVKDLISAFDNIQFIITTHSPQVLSSVQNSNIRVIDPQKEEGYQPVVNPYGKQSVVALEDIMNVSSTPPKEVIEEVGLLEEYLELIQKGEIEHPRLGEIREKLNGIYGSDYSKLLIADMLINQHKAKQ